MYPAQLLIRQARVLGRIGFRGFWKTQATGPKHLLGYSNKRFYSSSPLKTSSAGIVIPQLSQVDQRNRFSNEKKKSTLKERSHLQFARRLVIKLGSAVITREDEHGIALGRLASIVEQVAESHHQGRECIMVTSGAVAFGKQKLTQELLMSLSMRETLAPKDHSKMSSTPLEPRAAAAVGQSGLMSLYDAMFAQYGIKIAQVLVTKADFSNVYRCQNLMSTLTELLSLNIVPIINTNDAVEPAPQENESNEEAIIRRGLNLKDNDSLAAMLSTEINADLLILMSDVEGIYTKPPWEEGAKFIHTYTMDTRDTVAFGKKSKVGTGGMESKVNAAMWAIDRGVAVVICNGLLDNAVEKILAGRKVGTFFNNSTYDTTHSVEVMAENARIGSRSLQNLTAAERASVVYNLADLLVTKKSDILAANARDLSIARDNNLAGPLLDRLSLSESKLKNLSIGLKQIADGSHNIIGRVLRKTRLADGLHLSQITVPIGVLLVIFESRPDSLPQVASLAIASGNGLLLKGGKEAAYSNKALMQLVHESLASVGGEKAVSLVSTREEIGDLLQMANHIDLIIPRGSSDLVRNIQQQSQSIPVLGHSEGVCHVYVDKAADLHKAIKIIIDSKCDYPAACNAMETLLIHKDLMETRPQFFDDICKELKTHGVTIRSGPRLSEYLTFSPPLTKTMKFEYGSLECCIELVDSLEQAITHIHTYGSSHTDAIVTEDATRAAYFQNQIDSACVFHNASTRFADGFRFGLGAEVGISTTKIHARGPVGVEGLLTTKWVLRGDGHLASEFTKGVRTWIHESEEI